MCKEDKKEDKPLDYNSVFASIEFDLSESIKDLMWNIRQIKKDVDDIKTHLNLK